MTPLFGESLGRACCSIRLMYCPGIAHLTGPNQEPTPLAGHAVRSHGGGVREGSPIAHHLDALHEVAYEGLTRKERPTSKKARNSATYSLISLVPGSSTRRCSKLARGFPQRRVNWPWRCLRLRMRVDRAFQGQLAGLRCQHSSRWRVQRPRSGGPLIPTGATR